MAATTLLLVSAVCAANEVDFAREVRPILAEHCFQCHGPDDGQRQAGLRLDRRDGAVARLDSGEVAVKPGKARESELVRRIESADPAAVMPPPETKRTLTAAQKETLKRWIDAGAPYTAHWAYVAPVRPSPPVVRNAAWVRNPIDRFVLAKLEAKGLAPSSEADRITLIRRLSFDLRGLPPTVEEVDEFAADRGPEAYERLVDRMLVSPHFGEKAGQDWLDLARFGDSTGYQDDAERINWPYRDYVINALNANMPFDQFTVENLAGDLLPNATTWQRVASGFNRLHRHNEEGGSDPDEFQVVYAVDRTTTAATTWMGLTFGCAQCHDHKYDPLTQREFYQLYGFFNSLKGEVVITKGPFPPQIRVPVPEQQIEFDRIARAAAPLEKRKREIESQIESDFDGWLAQQKGGKVPEAPTRKPGAVGGVLARTTHAAFYADTRLESPLSLAEPIRASGRVAVVKSINNDVEVGYLATKALSPGPGLGFCVAEGPRFFASVLLGDGTKLHIGPIHAEHGVDYRWSFEYAPNGGDDDPADPDTTGEGLLTFRLLRGDKPVGEQKIDLTAAQRAVPTSFDAFGLSCRGAPDANSPIVLYLDEVEYVVNPDGKTRRQDFDRDPEWTGQGNQAHGHRFGYDPTSTTAGGAAEMSVPQILALTPDKRTPQHIARLREHFVAEKFPEVHGLTGKLAALQAERDAIEKSTPLALVWEEMQPPRPARLLVRGDYQKPADVVERNVPAVFPPLPADAPRDRLGLARWLLSDQHPLTARVAVNRAWKQCFGAGLVRTPEDFGVRGELPTHPELLDWLAVEFRSGPAGQPSVSAWDMKRLLRLIVTSSTYRQSSAMSPVLRETDPDNRLLARGSRFRLSAEEIRDAALVASGLISRRLGGRSVYPYQSDEFYREKEDDPGEWRWLLEKGPEMYRRGLYTFLRRTSPYPAYQTFDAPTRGECTVARSRTNTPLQALITLNDPTFVEAARVLGERTVLLGGGTMDERIAYAFRSVLSRKPSDRERQVLARLYQAEHDRYAKDKEAAGKAAALGQAPRTTASDVEVASWAAVATALLNLDEAITRE